MVPRPQLNRRSFVLQSTLAVAASTQTHFGSFAAEKLPEFHQATGVRVGEMTATSAIVWVRFTAHRERNNSGLLIPGRAHGKKREEFAKVTVPVEQLEGACPGADGRVRVRYSTNDSLADAEVTPWINVSQQTDFIHQFALTNLAPGTRYYYASETEGAAGSAAHQPLRGQFVTAPSADSIQDVRFCVMTCQSYPDRGHPDGHGIYPSMLAVKPHFASLTGDLVYYDTDEPRAENARLARYHWERMFSLPRLFEFTRQVGTYWLKDDHDTLDNDSWPGRAMGDLTFAEGQKIFREQAPVASGPSYRTIRWGRDLQIWFTDGRDFRTSNDLTDGPEKTIWGAEQKSWFKQTVKDSSATWKVLISPTPLVGPDRGKKNDNHANDGYKHEGDEIRNWLKEHVPDQFFVICGDRHWQYHSIHPQTGLNEFSVGPASDEHAGGTPGEDKIMHRFHRVKGGFLAVHITRKDHTAKIRFELRDVEGEVVYEWTQTREVV